SPLGAPRNCEVGCQAIPTANHNCRAPRSPPAAAHRTFLADRRSIMMTVSSGEQRFRVAVAGLRVGREPMVALAKHPAAEIRALCDPVEELAREMATAFGVPAIYADYGAMLAAEDLDGVCLATPNRLHAP